MPSINRFINTVGRCSGLWFADRLANVGIEPCDRPYLLYVCHHPGQPQDKLCRALCVNKSSVTRHVARLERAGLVSRTPSPEDGRVLLVSPTERALSLLPLLHETVKEWNAILTAGFSPEEIESFLSLLERALENAMRGVGGALK